MLQMQYTFDAVIEKSPDQDAAWVVFPHDLRKETGKGRAKANATFDGIPYRGSIVNMGLKHPDGSVCYILGMPKAVRQAAGKTYGDTVRMTIEIID